MKLLKGILVGCEIMRYVSYLIGHMRQTFYVNFSNSSASKHGIRNTWAVTGSILISATWDSGESACYLT